MLIDDLPTLMPWIETCDHLEIECAGLRAVCEDAASFMARFPAAAHSEEGRLLLRRLQAAVGQVEMVGYDRQPARTWE